MSIVRRRRTAAVTVVEAARAPVVGPPAVTDQLPFPRSAEGDDATAAVPPAGAAELVALVQDGAAAGGTATGPVLLVGSSGGHLAQLLPLAGLWSQDRVLWVTFPTPDADSQLEGRRVVHCYHPTTRNIPNLVRNGVLAWRLLRSERPSAVVSTGAGVAVPFVLLGRLLGIPTVFIEVYDRIDSATLTGRLCRPFASRVLVQWEEQRRMYPHAIVIGPLL